MTKITIIWILWWTPMFFLDCIIALFTLGLYLFVPEKKMFASRPSRWWMREATKIDAERDPILKQNLIKLGFYE